MPFQHALSLSGASLTWVSVAFTPDHHNEDDHEEDGNDDDEEEDDDDKDDKSYDDDDEHDDWLYQCRSRTIIHNGSPSKSTAKTVLIPTGDHDHDDEDDYGDNDDDGDDI